MLEASRSGSTAVFMIFQLSILVEIEEEEEFPPFGTQSSVDGLAIIGGFFQKKKKKTHSKEKMLPSSSG